MVNASLGGPLLRLSENAAVPLPVTTLGGAYGVRDDLEVYGDLHPTAYALATGGRPLLGLDVGGAWHPARLFQDRLVLTLGLAAYGFWHADEGVFFADGWAAADVRALAWLRFAGGMHNPTRLAASDAALGHARAWMPEVFLQCAVWPLHWRVELILEARWYAPERDTRSTLAPYLGIEERGAVGAQLGVTYHFGQNR